VTRQEFIRAVVLIPAAFRAAAAADAVLRGTLTKGPDGKPALKTAEGRLVLLDGDKDTVGVLNDARLAGADFEVIGQFGPSGTFAINPIHKRAMFVHKDGKRLLVTYWCDVCAIRTYTPGICWCCREETELDLRDPDTVE
jgi:hypothetical protein